MGSRPSSLALFCIHLQDAVGTKQDLMKAKMKSPLLQYLSPLLQLLHIHCPVRYRDNKREELKQRRGEFLSFRQGGKVLSAVNLPILRIKTTLRGRGGKGSSRNPLFLTCTLGGVIRTKHAGYLWGNKKQGPPQFPAALTVIQFPSQLDSCNGNSEVELKTVRQQGAMDSIHSPKSRRATTGRLREVF